MLKVVLLGLALVSSQIFASTFHPTPRTDKRAKLRHKLILEHHKFRQPKVVFFGDSLTEGWKFTQRGRMYFYQNQISNSGISSDGIQHLLWRLDNGALDHLQNTELFIVHIGTNNLYMKPVAIVTGINLVIKKIKARYPKKRIVVYGLFPGKNRSKVRDINYLLGASPFIKEFVDISFDLYIERKKNFYDGIHLTIQGYDIWLNSLRDIIK